MSKTYLPEDRLDDAGHLLQPSRPVLVTTRNEDGTVNVAPFSWLMAVSHHPPLVALALATLPKKQQTLLNIEREGTFVVNLPGLEQAEALVCTSFRYPEGVNKFAVVGFVEEPTVAAGVPGIAQCRAQLECRSLQMVPTGDHTTVVAAVVAAAYDPELFDENLVLRLDRAVPCTHLRWLRHEGGQTHFFVEAAGRRELDVPYGKASDFGPALAGAKAGTSDRS